MTDAALRLTASPARTSGLACRSSKWYPAAHSLQVGPAFDADISLATDIGSIDAPAIGESAGGLGSVEVAGTLGDGGPRLTVESDVGSIELTRR